MFALEIFFRDGVSQPETIFVRRPQAIIGGSDFAHVVIEDMKSLPYQLRLVKGLGRQFSCSAIGSKDAPVTLGGTFEGEASFDLSVVKLQVTSLDGDLLLRDGEPPDRAGVRVLRQACAHNTPMFPALMVMGAQPMVMSFSAEQTIYVGRSKRCALRLDSADISAEHARFGFEAGKFWVEDLGSTNGTFVNQQQISGRQSIEAGTLVVLGQEMVIVGVTSANQIQRLSHASEHSPVQQAQPEYPILLAVNELVRPSRVIVKPGMTINIGRDPASDMWIGAPHVSRKHGIVTASRTGALSILDLSTNGIACEEGVLKQEQSMALEREPRVFDFGSGVTIALCFNAEEEKRFLESHGSPSTFRALSGNASNFTTPQADVDGVVGVAPAFGARSMQAEPRADSFISRLPTPSWLIQEFKSLSRVGRFLVVFCLSLAVLILAVLVMLSSSMF